MKDEREILRKSIIERIAIKKSIYGLTARDAKNSEDEEARLLLYYDEAEYKTFQEHLGEELFNDVIKYNMLYNNKQNLILNKVPPNK